VNERVLYSFKHLNSPQPAYMARGFDAKEAYDDHNTKKYCPEQLQ
jgi:hypothetical protein